jgi:hypothetical protein
MIPRRIVKTLGAANATAVAAAQAAAAGGNLTLATPGGVALDTQRRVLITLTAPNSGNVFTVNGTNDGGGRISEVIPATAATTYTTANDFKSVTSVNVGAPMTGNISVGTNATGGIPWQAASPWINPYNLSLAVDIAGSANLIFSYTLDPDPCGMASPVIGPAAEYTLGTVMNPITSTGVALITTPVTAWRFTTTSGTGQAVIHALESGM